MVIMNDLECSMLSYYVIYYEKFGKVIQLTEKEALTTQPAQTSLQPALDFRYILVS